jgi:hypothetical protein
MTLRSATRGAKFTASTLLFRVGFAAVPVAFLWWIHPSSPRSFRDGPVARSKPGVKKTKSYNCRFKTFNKLLLFR